MIYEETMPGNAHDRSDSGKRAVVECDKPGCPESFYMPGVGTYTASERTRLLGWEVPPEVMAAGGFAARCPEHAQDAPVAHQHAWQRQHTLGFTACRLCGMRRA